MNMSITVKENKGLSDRQNRTVSADTGGKRKKVVWLCETEAVKSPEHGRGAG